MGPPVGELWRQGPDGGFDSSSTRVTAVSRLATFASGCIAAGVLFGAAGLPLPAQTVVGRILNENGAPVAGALVTLLDSAGRQHAAVLADSGGGYLVSSTVPGLHTVRAERIGIDRKSVV